MKIFIDRTTVTLVEMQKTIDQLRSNLADADRRAGEAERRLEYANDTIFKSNEWRDRAKVSLGYDRRISFDYVWRDVIELLGGQERARALVRDLETSRK